MNLNGGRLVVSLIKFLFVYVGKSAMIKINSDWSPIIFMRSDCALEVREYIIK